MSHFPYFSNMRTLPFFLLLTGLLAFALVACDEAKGSDQVETQLEPPVDPVQEAQRLQEKAQTYLIKNDTLWSQIQIDSNGISLFPHPDSSAEITLFYNELNWLPHLLRESTLEEAESAYLQKGQDPLPEGPNLRRRVPSSPTTADPDQPLLGWRIALDPGHIGGSMDFAFMEKKFIRIRAYDRPEIPSVIEFNEGNLALGTALLLRDTLEQLGAEVLLTREQEAQTGIGGTFEEWLASEMRSAESASGEHFRDQIAVGEYGYTQGQRKAAAWNWIQEKEITGADSLWWMNQADMRVIYRIPFLRRDFKARAKKINAFQPHMTLILHYNIYEKNEWDKDFFLRAVNENVSMAFIPGSFMKGELKDPESRMLFLNKLVSDDVEASELLAAKVVEGFEQVLGVPSLIWDDSLNYLRYASLQSPSKGVFARNLSLTRLVHGPVCYGEALYQDNVREALALSRKDFVLPGMQTPLPRRLHDAVAAYLHGILAYAKARQE